jgi:hypothetical protein
VPAYAGGSRRDLSARAQLRIHKKLAIYRRLEGIVLAD